MMRDSQPKTIYLKDYKVPPYLIETTSLTFDLNEDVTKVVSELMVIKNPASEESDVPLVLDGVDLHLLSVAIDRKELSSSEYQLNSESLQVDSVPERFVFRCETEIKPQENTCLEGLYRSSKMYCTQCEAEGFRRITYYLDRPDVMSVFTTKIIADKTSYPVLLSNGNEIERGDLDGGRHFAVWNDPFKKPCYLFALVAGDLHLHEDEFTTMSNRNIALRMYVEHENADKCDHGIDSLKKSMTWDEQVYGREYDLDIFMIVAVNDFNMGAMENKGLNIFNSSCVLAKPETTTDTGFDRVEAIVAHEYFHNWSGNRVTCRDWFQLSLKEGFTVFRDAEFTADMGSRTVKRIEDVNLLRTAQFAEDAGPMAHPVRPASYMEISNFYTLTVYEKGAEVVRMIHTLLGSEMFRKGSDLYFERFDGQAVTTDDFVAVMEEVSGRDLAQFKRWYEQAGTPIVDVQTSYDAAKKTYELNLKQHCPPSPNQKEKLPYHIPFAIGLLDSDGDDIALQSGGVDFSECETGAVLDFTEADQTFIFENVESEPTPSLLRKFSAPIRLNYNYSDEQLGFLMANDSDGFNRWDAGQKLAVKVLQGLISSDIPTEALSQAEVPSSLLDAYRELLSNPGLDQALVAKMLALPSEQYLIELGRNVDVQRVHFARERVKTYLAATLKEQFRDCYTRNISDESYRFAAADVAKRILKNASLGYLLCIGDEQAKEWALEQFDSANNMTDVIGALSALLQSKFKSVRDECLQRFYDKWKHDQQVVEQWFSIQAGCQQATSLADIEKLIQHAAFDIKNPNKVRSVIAVFASMNLVNFHESGGSGYQFLADKIIELDKLNPQIASRLVTPLSRWKKYNGERQTLMKAELQRIMSSGPLSKDVYEVVSKSIA